MTSPQLLPSPPTPTSRDVSRGPLSWLETSDLWPRRETCEGREELVRRFLPLARRLASRYRSANEPMDDLVQVASLGLLGAITRFDPDRGASFQSFAIPTILGELKRHFRRTGWSAHVPRGAQEMALRVNEATRELTAHTGRGPRVEAIAELLNVDVEDVLLGLEAGSAHYSSSLDAPAPGADSDEPLTVADSLGSADPAFGLIETTVSLTAAIAQLPHLERQALTLRLQHDMKQADIARHLGCSQMQVSRLLRRASGRLCEATPELN
jgi:RNA polymerase sigma-B factor